MSNMIREFVAMLPSPDDEVENPGGGTCKIWQNLELTPAQRPVFERLVSMGSPETQPSVSFMESPIIVPDNENARIHLVPATRVPEYVDELEALALQAEGLVGEIVAWIVSTAKRPNPVLALGTAVTVVGTVIGRRICGPTESGTHLYVIGLADTGGGKQHPLDCGYKLLIAAKLEHHIGPSEFISMPAVINRLLKSPLCLCFMDEFGAFLHRILSKKASGFENAITKLLRSAWGTSFGHMPTPEWAGREMAIINAPALSIYGVSTPDEFYKSLQAEDVSNGYLNRHLILSTKATPRKQNATLGEVPEFIKNGLLALYPNTVTAARLNEVTCVPVPIKADFASEAAAKAYHEIEDWGIAMVEANREFKPFLERVQENAIRLATIHAAGRWLNPTDFAVDKKDVEWGAAIAKTSGEQLARDALAQMEVTLTHTQLFNKVMSVIADHGGWAAERDLKRAMPRSVSKWDFDRMISTLKDRGMIVPHPQPVGPKGGRPSEGYAMVQA
jgi:hypothetical protein